MSADRARQFVVIFGPPAVGKMAVALELERLTGIRAFHNHMSIEPVLRFFAFGSAPFMRLVGEFRRHLVAEVAQSDLPGMSFTFVWDLDDDNDRRFLEEMCAPFVASGARVSLVELRAFLTTRLSRNRTPLRLAEKPSKRNLERSEQGLLDSERYRLNSDGRVPLPYRHLIIDNTERSADEVAEQVARWLSEPPTQATR